MVASKLKFIFLFLLSLQLIFLTLQSLHLSVIWSTQTDYINGMSMLLHKRSNEGSCHPQGYERVAKIVQAAKDRAWALKRGVLGDSKFLEEPLYYQSDAIEYYIKISMGTPTQDLLLVIDTGSNLVWAPCTGNYTCNNCLGYIPFFLPSKSSSTVFVRCADPKCQGVSRNCSQAPKTCPYVFSYGTGNTTGLLLTETLTLPTEDGGRQEINNFVMGCSDFSSGFAGIAGFGRGGLSMPSQLNPLLGKRFAYCLDNLNNSSRIVLGDKAVPKDIPLNYTPFLKNSRAYSDYYYIGLQGVSIGGKRLNLPSKLLTFDRQGNGGTVIDSGTAYTTFSEAIYNEIVGEFSSQIGYRRARDVEALTGLGLCYNVSGVENILFPGFAFHFKCGSGMVLPDENSFMLYRSGIYCLAMANTGYLQVAVGPAVILGHYQQKNIYMLYDIESDRLGYSQKTCMTLG